MKPAAYHQPASLSVFVLLLLAPVAMAQGVHVGGAVNSVAQRPSFPPAPAAAAALQGSASMNAQRPVRDGTGLNVNATTHAAARAQEHGLTVAALASSGATAEEIRTAAHANRDAVLADVDARIDAGQKATAQLRHQARGLEGDAKAGLVASLDEVKVREKAVKQSLKAARKAKGETQAEAQAKLADDYTAYAAAVMRAEAAATPATPAIPAIPREKPATPAEPATPSINAQGTVEAAGGTNPEAKS